MRIYLIGYMASGKSRLGQILAMKLGFTFIDLDSIFEERFRISISEFFEKYHEDAFRQIEHLLLLETTKSDNLVVSTGGGTPCFFDNMQIIKKEGFSVYLQLEIPTIVERLGQARRKRPLLKDISETQIGEKIRLHLIERSAFYEQADFILKADNESLEYLIERIVDRLNGLITEF
ncbi:MAG: AAA family ATPase [Bacteroidetes bacterium]|nr:AAA family ATPase [Bacteroidota bacterium]